MTTIRTLLENIDATLADRCRQIGPSGPTEVRKGDFVLYWMRTAIRIEENPAIDVACGLANRLGVPVLVYQGVTEKYKFASDRHHWFILQGARDVQAGIRQSRPDLAYALNVQRDGHRNRAVHTLARQASVVITEDFPVDPLSRWTRLVARQSPAPVIAVDTACVVPMQSVGRAHDRAFSFRSATKAGYASRVDQAPVSIRATRSFTKSALDELPFEPVDLQAVSIGDLVATARIDHSVGPVPYRVGGSVAGDALWGTFAAEKIDRYAKRRNDPLVDGVSRLSPYLHYGMVSPQKIARQANRLAREGSTGAEKFLDELLIWRELAYNFCFYRPDHMRVSALPGWARETLAARRGDRRSSLPSWEALARARSGDPLWDAAQTSLVQLGELHNNVRMTWGKAMLSWTPDAASCLRMLVDLNHRYALDGRDPASMGGILWVLGQFDRPFSPEQPILGTVRPRPTRVHAKRLDPAAYLRQIRRDHQSALPSVAVIGAGISGLVCARSLSDRGYQVTVFEKSRGPGGRMSTRRRRTGAEQDAIQFDHGAQYFTARSKVFRRHVDSWVKQGVAAPWEGRIVTLRDGQVVGIKAAPDVRSAMRYVGTPKMNSIGKHLAADLNVVTETRIESIRRSSAAWELKSADGEDLGRFDFAVVAVPPAQAASVIGGSSELARRASGVKMNPSFALMLRLDEHLDVPFDGAFVHESVLSWIARDTSKPERDVGTGGDCWVVHANAAWSAEHVDGDLETVQREMLAAFFAAVGQELSVEPDALALHRWLYAIPAAPLAEGCLYDADRNLVLCGDWCDGSRVEGAFQSGHAAAGRIIGHTHQALGNKPQAEQQTLFD